MYVSAASSSLPLSTQVIKRAGEAAQAPGAPVTPEQVNHAVDSASARVQQAQDNRAAEQANRRGAASQIYMANSQQNQIDIYLSVASQDSVESDQSQLSAANDLSEQVQRYHRAEAIDNRPYEVQYPESPAQPKVTPYIDTRA